MVSIGHPALYHILSSCMLDSEVWSVVPSLYDSHCVSHSRFSLKLYDKLILCPSNALSPRGIARLSSVAFMLSVASDNESHLSTSSTAYRRWIITEKK